MTPKPPDYIALAIDAGQLVACEYEHGTLWHPADVQCPACDAISDARNDRDAAESRANSEVRRRSDADSRRQSAEREAQQERSNAEDLAWRRKLGNLHPWER